MALLGRGKGGREGLGLRVGVHRSRGRAVLLAQLGRLLEGICLDRRGRGASIPYGAAGGVVVLGARHVGGPGRRRLMV